MSSAMLARLLHRIATVEQPSALLALLDDSFAYIVVDELMVVPVAIMQRLATVPKRFLRRMAEQRTVLQVRRTASRACQPATACAVLWCCVC